MIPYRLIFETGARLRNPSLADHAAFLKQSEVWDLERLKAYQLKRCQTLLRFAYANSPFYKRMFDASGFAVSDFVALDDLKRIPPIVKHDLLAHNQEIHTTGNHHFKKLFVAETSGSTGQPLMFMKDEAWDSWTRAAVFRGYSWYGVQPWERNGYFWGYNIDPARARKTRLLDTIQNRFRVFSYDRKALIEFIGKLEKATYLHGYSSMIYEVARIINAEGLDTSKLKLKLVKGTSEKIYDHYHAEVRKAFGQKIVSEYGAAEAGFIAFECPHGSMHLNMEGCIVEEEGGEIVVTNLNAYSFPIIRYKLGDSIKLEEEGSICPCGMQHRVLKEVTGRVGKLIYGKERTYPSLTIYYVFKNIYLEHNLAINGQFVQEMKGRLIVKVEGPLSTEGRVLLERQLQTYFGDDMGWEFVENAEIHTMDGKRKDFISLVNADH